MARPYIWEMTSKTQTKPQSPEKLARLEKKRVARIEGDIALAEIDKQYVDVRKNMERLRALRLAKEAEELALPPVKMKRKRPASKKLAVVKTQGTAVSDG